MFDGKVSFITHRVLEERLHSLYCFDNIITMAAKKNKIYYLCKYRMATSRYPKCFLTCLNPLGMCILATPPKEC